MAVGVVVEELAKRDIEHFPDLVPYLPRAGHATLHAADVA